MRLQDFKNRLHIAWMLILDKSILVGFDVETATKLDVGYMDKLQLAADLILEALGLQKPGRYIEESPKTVI